MKRLLAYHTPGPDGGEWRIVNDPTIGDIRSGRRKGALVLRRVVERKGGRIYGAWVTDWGQAIVVFEHHVQVP